MTAIQSARRLTCALLPGTDWQGRGSFYWGGAFGTWFWLDPVNDVVVVGMIQNVNGSSPTGGSPQVRPLSRKLVYQALVDRKK